MHSQAPGGGGEPSLILQQGQQNAPSPVGPELGTSTEQGLSGSF